MQTNTTTEGLILDVRERLARIEVKIDGTNEKLRDHDERISSNREDIDTLKSAVVAYNAKVATYAKVGGIAAAASAVIGWFIEHATVVASVATAVPH